MWHSYNIDKRILSASELCQVYYKTIYHPLFTRCFFYFVLGTHDDDKQEDKRKGKVPKNLVGLMMTQFNIISQEKG
jgi:hypothetical protein